MSSSLVICLEPCLYGSPYTFGHFFLEYLKQKYVATDINSALKSQAQLKDQNILLKKMQSEKKTFHRIIKQLSLKGTSGVRLIQSPTQSRVNYNMLLKDLIGQVLKTSKDGPSTTSLDNPFQYLTTFKYKKLLLITEEA